MQQDPSQMVLPRVLGHYSGHWLGTLTTKDDIPAVLADGVYIYKTREVRMIAGGHQGDIYYSNAMFFASPEFHHEWVLRHITVYLHVEDLLPIAKTDPKYSSRSMEEMPKYVSDDKTAWLTFNQITDIARVFLPEPSKIKCSDYITHIKTIKEWHPLMNSEMMWVYFNFYTHAAYSLSLFHLLHAHVQCTRCQT